MKEYTYKPSADSGFSGHVKIRIMSFKERLDIAKTFDADSPEFAKTFVSDMYERTAKEVIEVKLTYGELNIEVNSFDDLGYYEAGQKLIMEIGGIIFKGIPVSTP